MPGSWFGSINYLGPKVVALSSPSPHLIFRGSWRESVFLSGCWGPTSTCTGTSGSRLVLCLFWSCIKPGRIDCSTWTLKMSGTPPDLPPSPTALISEEALSSETHRHTWMILHKSAGPSPGRARSSSGRATGQRRRHGQQNQHLCPVLQLRILPGLLGPHARGWEEAESQ